MPQNEPIDMMEGAEIETDETVKAKLEAEESRLATEFNLSGNIREEIIKLFKQDGQDERPFENWSELYSTFMALEHEKTLKTYDILVREIHYSHRRVHRVESIEQAKKLAADAEERYLEYSDTCDPETWIVEEVKENK